MRYPFFNDDTENQWLYIYNHEQSSMLSRLGKKSHIELEFDLEPFIQEDLCVKVMPMMTLDDLLAMDCRHKDKEKRLGCLMLRDEAIFAKRLEIELQTFGDIMAKLSPRFRPVGSFKEETIIGLPNETDYGMTFEGWTTPPFKLQGKTH